jgi:hypothetical protein
MDESFYVNVFIDTVHRIHYQIINPGVEAESVVIWMSVIDQRADNIVVSDTIDMQPNASYITTTTTSPTETTTTTPDTTTPPPAAPPMPLEIIAIGAVVAVILVILVVVMKRRG